MKRWSKSPPRFRQRKWHGKPHWEQDQIGVGARRGQLRPRSWFRPSLGLVARGATQVASQTNDRRGAQAPDKTRLTGRLAKIFGAAARVVGSSASTRYNRGCRCWRCLVNWLTPRAVKKPSQPQRRLKAERGWRHRAGFAPPYSSGFTPAVVVGVYTRLVRRRLQPLQLVIVSGRAMQFSRWFPSAPLSQTPDAMAIAGAPV